MCKSDSFNRTIASVLFFLFLFLGCEKAEPPQQQMKPVVLKKRIEKEMLPVKPETHGAPPAGKAIETPATSETKETVSVSVTPEESSASVQSAGYESDAASGVKRQQETAQEGSLTDKIADASPRYDPTGKPDPFEPLFKEAPSVAVAETKAKRRRPLTPLEKIDLSQLKLVGVIRGESGNRALVEDATGKGYIVSKGTYIGIHGGRVIEIEKKSAVIEEEVEDILGNITVSRQELKLQKPAGEE